MTATGRKKLDELYHPAAERTEFYHMADLHKPPVLFSPSEEVRLAQHDYSRALYLCATVND